MGRRVAIERGSVCVCVGGWGVGGVGGGGWGEGAAVDERAREPERWGKGSHSVDRARCDR